MKLDELKERKKSSESMVFTSNFNSLNKDMCNWMKEELIGVQKSIDIIERNKLYNDEMKIKMISVLSNILSIYVDELYCIIENSGEKLTNIKKRIKKLIFNDININDFLNEYVNILNDFIRLDEKKIRIDVIFNKANIENNVFESNINENYIIYSVKLYLKEDDKETSLVRFLYHDNIFSILSLDDVCIKNKDNDIFVPVKEENKINKLNKTAVKAIILSIISTISVVLFVVKPTFTMSYISGFIFGIIWLYTYLK